MFLRPGPSFDVLDEVSVGEPRVGEAPYLRYSLKSGLPAIKRSFEARIVEGCVGKVGIERGFLGKRLVWNLSGGAPVAPDTPPLAWNDDGRLGRSQLLSALKGWPALRPANGPGPTSSHSSLVLFWSASPATSAAPLSLAPDTTHGDPITIRSVLSSLHCSHAQRVCLTRRAACF